MPQLTQGPPPIIFDHVDMDSMSFEGVVLDGKYRLVSMLGKGGMGSVWRAEHLSLQAPIAVKLIDPGIAEMPEALERFNREAKAAAALRSPHVVQILDYGVDTTTGAPFIAMELMEGESLADRLDRVGCLSPNATARIITHVARALSKAHAAGIVHRDLKPDNIFLIKNEDEEIAKVLDFGIAKSESHSVGSATATGAVMGTAYYMSPEQISGSRTVDYRTDLWALGVIAYECLTGKRPFVAETLGGMALRICTEPISRPSLVGMVPAGFDEWFLAAVNRNVDQRFQSARELADALVDVCRGSFGATVSSAAGAAAIGREPAMFDSGSNPMAGRGHTQTGDALMGSASARHAESAPHHDTAISLTHTQSGPKARAARSAGLVTVVSGVVGVGVAVGGWFLYSQLMPQPVEPETTQDTRGMIDVPGSSLGASGQPTAAEAPIVPVPTSSSSTVPPTSTDAGTAETVGELPEPERDDIESAEKPSTPGRAETVRARAPVISRPAIKRPAPEPETRPAPTPRKTTPSPKGSPFDGILNSRK